MTIPTTPTRKVLFEKIETKFKVIILDLNQCNGWWYHRFIGKEFNVRECIKKDITPSYNLDEATMHLFYMTTDEEDFGLFFIDEDIDEGPSLIFKDHTIRI